MGNETLTYALVCENDFVVPFHDTPEEILNLIDFLNTSRGYAQNFKFWIYENIDDYEDVERNTEKLHNLQRLYSIMEAYPTMYRMLDFLYEWKKSDFCTFGTIELMDVVYP